MNKNIKIEPIINEDGWYASCPTCGYFDLLPKTDKRCPECDQLLDWDWYHKSKNK